MKKLLLIFFFLTYSYSQDNLISDGPYIFIDNGNLIEKEIIDNQVFIKTLKPSQFDTLFYPSKSIYKNVSKIAALSDIHGQYDLFITLLMNNKIIDKNLNWIFGKGHLVINGDIFDRGDQVNETLWFVYKLELQAIKNGGMVHFLLGNHEYMVLYDDLRYVNSKYKLSAGLLDLDYDMLYSNKTVLGRWLRSKSTIIKINNVLFTHGGISKEFVSKVGSDIEAINNTMRISIPKLKNLRKLRKSKESNEFYDLYFGSQSLIWYRGFFKNDFTSSELEDVLNLFDAEHIAVGHSTQKKIVQLHENRIFGIDTGIKKGKSGEVLLIEGDRFYGGSINGQLRELNQ